MNNQKVKMTHNEFVEFMKKNANRLYTEKGYTMAQYNQDCDSVEVLDYDLSRFQLGFSEGQLKIINSYFTEESVNRLGHTLLKGHMMNDGAERRVANTLGIDLVANGSYSGFGKSDENQCVFEFCEGDIYLVLCESKEAYRAELESYCEFYDVDMNKVIEEVSEMIRWFGDVDIPYDFPELYNTGFMTVAAGGENIIAGRLKAVSDFQDVSVEYFDKFETGYGFKFAVSSSLPGNQVKDLLGAALKGLSFEVAFDLEAESLDNTLANAKAKADESKGAEREAGIEL